MPLSLIFGGETLQIKKIITEIQKDVHGNDNDRKSGGSDEHYCYHKLGK